MEWKTKIEAIKRELATDLPGESAHLPMSPLGRGRSSELKKKAKKFREAAVAVILFPKDDKMQIILTQRAQYEGTHSGQISFPGGSKEAYDEDLISTAIRETHEEIDLTLDKTQFLGTLTDVFIPVSSFAVHPQVFFHPTCPNFENNYEVVETFWISLNELLDEHSVSTMNVTLQNGFKLTVPCFSIRGHSIWGATAIMLNEFKLLLKNLE